MESSRRWGGAGEPITLTVANRLFGQEGFEFLPPFLATLQDTYEAPLKTLDFAGDPKAAARHINEWVEDRTNWRISDLIAPGVLTRLTRLVLVNAVYLKAGWEVPFRPRSTQPRRFHLTADSGVDVPMMREHLCCGYQKFQGFRAVAIPYHGGALHLLILLPDEIDGLASLEKELNGETLMQCAKLEAEVVSLLLPKFRLEPDSVLLKGMLKALGLSSLFDEPKGAANLERMSPRHGDNYLSVGEVVHKTFLSLDENGTEAAAATAVVAVAAGAPKSKVREPEEVRVDHPFLFAIQHRATATCLFLGRVVDPV
jgi:serpin B